MAAGEARAVWQRTVNRYFVQEDAKRAPKLACCQSSSTASKPSDSGPTGAADTLDHPVLGFMPLNRNPSFGNLPPDTRWWLQMQPCYGCHKGLTHDQVVALESEIEGLKTGITDSPLKENIENLSDKEDATVVDIKKCYFCPFDVQQRVSSIKMDGDVAVKKLESKALPSKTTRDIFESADAVKNYEFGSEQVKFPVSKKPRDSSIDPQSPWIGSDKVEPWWRTTDRDELASLVAQKSLDFVENCDLPPPQKLQPRRFPVHTSEASSLDQKGQAGNITSPMLDALVSPDSGNLRMMHRTSVEEGNSSMQGFSDNSSSATQKDSMETQFAGTDPSKAELLDALRHSQTRAREAENAAKQAYAEKEHVIQLFFKQASQLFAYKQWFQMLQLEAFYLHIKHNEQPISTFFPSVLPRLPYRVKLSRKKGKQKKVVEPRPDVTKYAVAFALGLSLVGAGLLLGWTVGWMLPF